MLIAKKLTIDLVNRPLQREVHAVQCDSNTRAVEVTLTVAGVPWQPPEGTTVSVAFRKPDGNKGWYDQLPDGKMACTVAGNVVTAILAPEVLTAPGRVNAAILFQDAELNQLSTFGFTIEVEPNPAAGNVISNSYYKYSTMEAVDAAMEAIENAIADLESGKTDAVLYTQQTLTPEQQAQARENIGAVDNVALASETEERKAAIASIEEDLYSISDNLFNYAEVVLGKIPNLGVGSSKDNFVSMGNWVTSNYIPVVAENQYCVIREGNLTARQFTVAYYSNGVLVSKDGPATNPFTIPSGVDAIYVCASDATIFLETGTSIKEYSADMNYDWHKFGNEKKFLSNDALDALNEYGVYVSGSTYYHFVKFGTTHIIRKFRREGANNLFQFSGIYKGFVAEDGVTIGETITNHGTDIVGPISISRGEVDGNIGRWSGGYHSITVDGVAYPTAEQESLSITLNGEDISNVNGLHIGMVRIVAKNKLYFPQTVSGSDLSSATQAILETREYILDKSMNVKVSLDFIADTRVALYYGLQAVRVGFDSIQLPSNETELSFADLSTGYKLEKKDRKVILKRNDMTYELTLKDYGLGDFSHNSGETSYKYGVVPSDIRKFYQVLIAGAYEHTWITAGKKLYWEGVYDIYC